MKTSAAIIARSLNSYQRFQTPESSLRDPKSVDIVTRKRTTKNNKSVLNYTLENGQTVKITVEVSE